MKVLETQRLVIRWFDEGDAPFILELLNDPGWIRFIGNKNVKTLDDARAYIRRVPIAAYEREGFGLSMVELKENGEPLGMCGLIRRPGLDDVDVGFAFLPRYRSQGYAFESSAAVLAHGRDTLALGRVVAITSEDNHDSARLLEKLGFRFEKSMHLPGDPEPVRLYATNLREASP
jgi:RimJ/RimL family protein N-acetyltransferase